MIKVLIGATILFAIIGVLSATKVCKVFTSSCITFFKVPEPFEIIYPKGTVAKCCDKFVLNICSK